jgi:nucleotide-binding universal stress UspA family protein
VKRILVATDFSAHSQRALVHALELAKLFGAELELFTSAYIPPQTLAALTLGMVPSVIDDARKEASQKLAALAGTLRARDLRVGSSFSTEEPSGAICARASELGADLVALGTRGHTGLAHVLFGSVAERVARLAPAPVLTAHADSPAPAGHRCVLVPTDFSPDADAALAWARALVARTGGKLVLVHAYDLASLATTSGALAAASVEKALAESARQKLAELKASLSGVEVDTVLSAARADPAIFDTAERAHADLIAIGTRGRTGLAHVVLGSTAERVIRRAHVPVVTVKAPAKP